MKRYKIYVMAIVAGVFTALISLYASGNPYELVLWSGWILVLSLSGVFWWEKVV